MRPLRLASSPRRFQSDHFDAHYEVTGSVEAYQLLLRVVTWQPLQVFGSQKFNKAGTFEIQKLLQNGSNVRLVKHTMVLYLMPRFIN